MGVDVNIARAPMRVSFLGGGTDFPNYYKQEGMVGRVLGTTIDKYVYAYALNQPDFENVKIRFNYRTSESVESVDQIQHPVAREALKLYGWDKPINIGTMADLPGRSGLGSSSAFTVAFIALLEKLLHRESTHHQLAESAIKLEREVLAEEGGHQDQFHAAIGGFRLYEYSSRGVTYDKAFSDSFSQYLGESLVLYAPSESRSSKDFANFTSQNIDAIRKHDEKSVYAELSQLTLDVFEKIQASQSNEKSLSLLGEGMSEAWKLKQKISRESSQATLDVIDKGLASGALAGKLCGAGGSGFVAFLVPPDAMTTFSSHFDASNLVYAKPSNAGVEIFTI